MWKRLLSIAALAVFLPFVLLACEEDDHELSDDVRDAATAAAGNAQGAASRVATNVSGSGTAASGSATARSNDNDSIEFDLDEQNNSGYRGKAKLTKDGSRTRVDLEIEKEGDEGAVVSHVHKGSCGNLDQAVAFPLGALNTGKSATTLNVNLDEFRRGYAIDAHIGTGPTIVCGNMPG